jgi:hypothetical protein
MWDAGPSLSEQKSEWPLDTRAYARAPGGAPGGALLAFLSPFSALLPACPCCCCCCCGCESMGVRCERMLGSPVVAGFWLWLYKRAFECGY